MTTHTDTTDTAAESGQRPETGRDRVRRLLFDPLGFRWPARTDPADGRARLDALADELGYMSDGALTVLARLLRVHGHGSARAFWPDRATFVGFAHQVEPLPLDRDPALLRWFASVEGPKALAEGTLVETWDYFQRRRVPPVTPEARRWIATRAAESARRLEVLADRRKFALPLDPDEIAWAGAYTAHRDRIAALVAEARAGREAAE